MQVSKECYGQGRLGLISDLICSRRIWRSSWRRASNTGASKDSAWVNKGMPLNLARLTCKWENTNISRSAEFEWAMMWALPHQNPPPQQQGRAVGFWGAIVGPKICGPSPPCIKGLKPRPKSPTTKDVWWKSLKGPRMWPRTISRSTPHKTPEVNDKLSTRALQGRKLPTP